MQLIVLVVIDCGVSTTVNTTILLIYMLSTIYIVYFLFVKKSLKIPGDDDVSPIGLKPISQSVR